MTAAGGSPGTARDGYRTAAPAVPDPRFRDQLARWVPHTMGCFAHRTDDVGMDYRCICFHDGLVDRLAPQLEAHIAAEVEARVQAAANQRAEEADALRHNLRELCDSASDGYVPVAWLRELASPAPAPQGEEGT